MPSEQKNELDHLISEHYEELKRLANIRMRRERPGHTLQATGLLHEVYFRLSEQRSQGWNNRAHFFAAVSEVMRRILVNHALARKTDKRGGDWLATTLGAVDRAGLATDTPGFDVLDLDRALEALAQLDARQAKLVELRYFAGLTLEETAEAMALSPATVKREWATARLWLKRELERQA